jgi:hypothetical protein
MYKSMEPLLALYNPSVASAVSTAVTTPPPERYIWVERNNGRKVLVRNKAYSPWAYFNRVQSAMKSAAQQVLGVNPTAFRRNIYACGYA